MRLQGRPITTREIEVIREAVTAAPLVPDAVDHAADVDKLRVTGRCPCGCASVDFGPTPEPGASYRIADGLGTTESGGTVGVLIWASDHQVTGIEIYDLGAGDADQTLPRTGSIRPLPDGASSGA